MCVGRGSGCALWFALGVLFKKLKVAWHRVGSGAVGSAGGGGAGRAAQGCPGALTDLAGRQGWSPLLSRGWNCGVVWLFNFIHSWLKDWAKSLPLLCVGGKVQPEGWRGRDLGRTCHPRAAWIGKGMTNTKSSFDALCDSGISTIPDEGVCVQSPSEALRNALWGSM